MHLCVLWRVSMPITWRIRGTGKGPSGGSLGTVLADWHGGIEIGRVTSLARGTVIHYRAQMDQFDRAMKSLGADGHPHGH